MSADALALTVLLVSVGVALLLYVLDVGWQL